MANQLWKARTIKGPWQRLQPEPLVQLSYPKTAPFKNNRLLTAGWIGHQRWGGDLAFRELIQHADGSLGTRFVPEMVPHSGPPLDLQPAELQGETEWHAGHLTMKSIEETPARIPNIPPNVRITLQAEPACSAWRMALQDARGQGVAIYFDLQKREVGFETLSPRQNADQECPSLNPVEGLDGSLELDLIVKDGIIDLCIDNRHTLITRRTGTAANQLGFIVKGRTATFSQIAVRPLIS